MPIRGEQDTSARLYIQTLKEHIDIVAGPLGFVPSGQAVSDSEIFLEKVIFVTHTKEYEEVNPKQSNVETFLGFI